MNNTSNEWTVVNIGDEPIHDITLNLNDYHWRVSVDLISETGQYRVTILNKQSGEKQTIFVSRDTRIDVIEQMAIDLILGRVR